MARLTKQTCDRFTFTGDNPKAFCVLWDGELKGFGLRVYPTGRKSFIIKYRHAGRQGIHKIGPYGPLTVEQARKMATAFLGELAQGIDPATRKAQDMTFADLANRYMEDYSKVHKKSWQHDQRRLDSRLLPTFGGRTITSITRQEVIRYHQKIGAEVGIYAANRELALLSTMFEYAREIELIPFDHSNPARLVERFKETSREVFISRETELPRLLEVLEQEPNVYVRSAILLFLLTGCRKTELLSSKWEWVNWDRRELRLPDTKSGRPHVVPLVDAAIEILRGLPRQAGNDYVFPSLTHPGKRFQSIDPHWRRIRAAAGLEHVHLHDLRRSIGSWMAADGVSLYVIGRVLGHADVNTTQIYARLKEDPARAALDQSAKVLDIVKLRKKESKESGAA